MFNFFFSNIAIFHVVHVTDGMNIFSSRTIDNYIGWHKQYMYSRNGLPSIAILSSNNRLANQSNFKDLAQYLKKLLVILCNIYVTLCNFVISTLSMCLPLLLKSVLFSMVSSFDMTLFVNLH